MNRLGYHQARISQLQCPYFAHTLLGVAPKGRTTLGHGAMDISIQGPGVAAQHCYIENRAGIITLHPCGNQCATDGLPVTKPVRLSQGMAPYKQTDLWK